MSQTVEIGFQAPAQQFQLQNLTTPFTALSSHATSITPSCVCSQSVEKDQSPTDFLLPKPSYQKWESISEKSLTEVQLFFLV